MFAGLKGALQAALSTSDEARKQSQQMLQALEPQPGYLSSLLQITLETDSSGGARELAGITLKHGCSKFWKDLSGEEKTHLKSELLDKIEAVSTDGVAVHLSLCIGRIARTDFPGQWQELFPRLMQKLGQTSNNSLCDVATKRILYVLHCVIKELASKRLPVARKGFQELSQQLIPAVWGLFCRSSEQVAASLGPGGAPAGPDALLLAQVWLLCAKCMKRLLVSGFPPDAKSFEVHSQFKEIVPQTLEVLKVVHQRYVGASAASAPPAVLRGMLKILKLLRDLVDSHPWSFSVVEISVPTLEYLYFNVCSSPDQGVTSLFVEDVCMLSMQVLQSIMRSPAYRSPLDREADPSRRQLVEGAQQLLSNFFSAERLDQMTCTVVGVHMTLKAYDLEKWQAEPEEFHHENDLGNFNETLRSESEKLLCKFLETFKGQTISTLMKLLNQVQGVPQGGADLQQLLLKESMYNAMCLAAYDLHDSVNFKMFFESQLGNDFSFQREENKIIVRRAAYLLAAWVADVPEEMRPQVYNLLMNQLLPCEDMVIKLAACAVMRVFIDDWNFYEEQFHPFLHSALRNLLLVIQQAYDFDSQVQAFNVLCLILERMGTRVKPFANEIVAMIPDVWQKAQDQSLLKIQILNAMHRMMQCLGASSVATYNIVIPLLQYSVNPDGPESVSIFEDALLLLRSVLQFAAELSPQLAGMLLFVTTHMQRSTEYLPISAKILEAYMLVGGLPILQMHGATVFNTLLEVTNSVNSRGLTMVTPVLDIILQIFPPTDLALLEGIFFTLLNRLGDESETDEALIHIACILSRLAVTNLAYFLEMLVKYGKERCGNEDVLFDRLIYVWTEKAYASSSSLKRKILCVGLILTLDTKHSSIISRMDCIGDFLLEVANEFKLPNSLDNINVAEEWHEGEDVDDYACIHSQGEEDPEAVRRSRLWSADPVNKAQVVGMIQERVASGAFPLNNDEFKERFKLLSS